ncbi:MAG: phospho-N-acetylmuramoyl-pentapeptide-transferase [Armatimonadota bacterium]
MPSDFVQIMIVFVLAVIASVVFTWLVRKWVIAQQMGQTVREDGPQSHLKKMGTPTLGGLGFMAALTLLTGVIWLLRGRELNPAVPLCLGLALAYAGIGFADDWSKLRYKRPLGLKARARVPLEMLLAGVFALLLIQNGIMTPEPGAAQLVPFGSGVVAIIVAMFVIVGGANATNLTDGLDGLAAGVTCFAAVAVSAACFLLGNSDLALLAGALAGVCAGFLWLNCHPASIFMGDIGSLGLGAALAGIAVAARMELLLGLFGLIFVIEALSVIIQVLYFKRTGGKRIFRMAPFHHHLELGGMAETKVVTRFWIITMIAGAAGVAIVGWLTTGMLVGS